MATRDVTSRRNGTAGLQSHLFVFAFLETRLLLLLPWQTDLLNFGMPCGIFNILEKDSKNRDLSTSYLI